MVYRLLVVEGPGAGGSSVRAALASDHSFECVSFDWSMVTSHELRRNDTHAVVAVPLPSQAVVDQFALLRRCSGTIPTLAVLSKEQEISLQLATRSVDDFVLSPVCAVELHARLHRILGTHDHGMTHDALDGVGVSGLVGNDPAFVLAIKQVPRFARTDMPVLVTGETGTGKELCARALHTMSKRSTGPFVAADRAALPDQLFENELFGHARGAFTDAHRVQHGLIRIAEGGTLFLDEVDALSPSAQGKLLRFLQERTFRPLGADRFESADVNILAATNRDLEACVQSRHFRSDLFFRLNVLRVHLPPLRERCGDVAWLAWHFLEELRQREEPLCKSFSVSALRKLSQYDWPGNVRELRNVVLRAAVLADKATILPSHLTIPEGRRPSGPSGSGLRQARAQFEQSYVEQLMQKHRGNITHAAAEAQKERRAFGRLVKKYNLSPDKPG